MWGGVIAVHPQLNYKSAARYEKDNWKRQISECGYRFVEIDDLIAKSTVLPNIYLEISQHCSDSCGVNELVAECVKKKSFVLINQDNTLEHNTQEPSLNKIMNLIDFFEKCNNFC